MAGPTAKDVQIAVGIAAHAIVVELVAALRIKGILTEAECAKITDSALLSRQLFEIQAQTWSPSGKV